jgi:hypothetical protein
MYFLRRIFGQLRHEIGMRFHLNVIVKHMQYKYIVTCSTEGRRYYGTLLLVAEQPWSNGSMDMLTTPVLLRAW